MLLILRPNIDASVVDIAGVSTSVSTDTGNLSVKINVGGPASGVSTDTGNLSVKLNVDGAADGVATDTGTVTVIESISGEAQAVSTDTGFLSIAIDGHAVAVATDTGAVGITYGIRTDIQSLSPSALIEMFILDMTSVAQGLLYFHAGTNSLTNDIVWQGHTYVPIPVEAEGFAAGTTGSLPRPKIRLANIDGAFSATVATYNDLIGFKVTRKRTFLKYLDAVNFPGEVNVSADSNQHYPDDVWFIDQKVSENRYVIEWELASAFDVIGVMLPSRQVNQNSCPWAYRGSECGYTGTAYFDSLDVASTLPNDVCGKRLKSCENRFGANAVLPFGGFPGAISF